MGESILRDKSYDFAIQIIQVCQILNSKKEFVLSKQLLKAGTSIGAMTREAEFGQSRKDFINKLSVSLKEANETIYWLNLLKDTHIIAHDDYKKLKTQCDELIRMLVSSVKTSKLNLISNS